jgi:Protein of unknown function (DUF2934)
MGGNNPVVRKQITMARKQGSENKVVVSSAAAVPARRKSASRIARPTSVESSNAPASQPEEAPIAAAAESFQEAVARLAFSYWEARGCQGGSPEADWLRAEQELRAK